MNRTTAIIFLTAYIVGWVVYAISAVGETSSGVTYSWTLPLKLFLLVSFPAILGYEIGKARSE